MIRIHKLTKIDSSLAISMIVIGLLALPEMAYAAKLCSVCDSDKAMRDASCDKIAEEEGGRYKSWSVCNNDAKRAFKNCLKTCKKGMTISDIDQSADEMGNNDPDVFQQ